ncbi:MAG TPA: helix-turn-helix domain-containing protein [Usitatibacter sp.]|nr:helix-turn-helix domain-containing protein [Usitatibacter sp.]
MKRFDAFSASCPARAILASVANKWTVLVLSVLTEDTTRFNELRRRVQGVTQKALTQTLRDLERLGLVSRRIYAEVPPRVEYSLTPLGRSLVKVLDDIKAWTETHAPEVMQAQQRFDRQAEKRRAAAA